MTKEELELLGLLQEECAEVIQIVSKIRRFGYESYNPFDPSGKSNLTLLQDEIGDVYAVMALLLQEGHLKQGQIGERVQWKLKKLEENWGYKLLDPVVDNQLDGLIADLEVLLDCVREHATVATGGYKVPAEAAVSHLEKALHSLKTPEPKPFVEALMEMDFSGLVEELEHDRRLENICYDIRSTAEGREPTGSDERKYLLRQAADILKQIAQLHEERIEYED